LAFDPSALRLLEACSSAHSPRRSFVRRIQPPTRRHRERSAAAHRIDTHAPITIVLASMQREEQSPISRTGTM